MMDERTEIVAAPRIIGVIGVMDGWKHMTQKHPSIVVTQQGIDSCNTITDMIVVDEYGYVRQVINSSHGSTN